MNRLVLALVFVIPATVAIAAQQVAPGLWQMSNYGRNHGMITGPGIPKCMR